ncbi:MAG: pyridoxamine 5'-phosphate oxidase family protein [Candidatus Levybacteria bacterium]|nr:pyridoxamine 5'-phosphate oxidase family protein [Candidatus Levybacteria bacterium]
MIQGELNKLAKDIIKNNIYLTLATTDGKTPWSSPLFYCIDDSYNFYFISQMDCVHTKNVLVNPKVGFSIFDSHAPEGKGNGVQASGSVNLLKGKNEIVEALRHYHTSFIKCEAEDFTGLKPYRLFKLIPEKFFVLDSEADVDKRVKVKL